MKKILFIILVATVFFSIRYVEEIHYYLVDVLTNLFNINNTVEFQKGITISIASLNLACCFSLLAVIINSLLED